MPESEITCVGCPLGCQVRLKISKNGDIQSAAGNYCKKGRLIAIQEFVNPTRVLTTTVSVKGGARQILPVRTDKPVPKGSLRALMRLAASVEVEIPIGIGQEIVHNIGGSGANLIATRGLTGESSSP